MTLYDIQIWFPATNTEPTNCINTTVDDLDKLVQQITHEAFCPNHGCPQADLVIIHRRD
jgi:hypothetical protein